MTVSPDTIAEIEALAENLRTYLPHTFQLVSSLPDGSAIPPEALSEDHTVGLYGSVIPRKMRESLDGFREIHVADLLPQEVVERTPTGVKAEWFLEYPGLRNVRFRSERLQYLEEGWWAITSEVKYPAATTLSVMHVIKQRYGAAFVCLNIELPMPLWIRSAPLAQEQRGVDAVIQARGEGRILFTNIHSECTMEAARPYAQAVRRYYRSAAVEPAPPG